jgi:hypothetical protein
MGVADGEGEKNRTVPNGRLRMIKRMSWFLLAATLGVAGCTAEVEDRGEPPRIDVEPGRAPSIDLQPAEVEVRRDTQTVVVPNVDVRPADRRN